MDWKLKEIPWRDFLKIKIYWVAYFPILLGMSIVVLFTISMLFSGLGVASFVFRAMPNLAMLFLISLFMAMRIREVQKLK